MCKAKDSTVQFVRTVWWILEMLILLSNMWWVLEMLKLMHPPDNDDVINAKSQIPLVGQENQENLCLWKVLCIIITSMTGIGIGIRNCICIGIGIAIAIGIGDGIGVGIGILIVLSSCRHLIVSDI